jgi:hypothetical protein
MQFPQKTKNRQRQEFYEFKASLHYIVRPPTSKKTSYDPAIPLPDISPNEMKSAYQRNTCTLLFIVVLVIIA